MKSVFGRSIRARAIVLGVLGFGALGASAELPYDPPAWENVSAPAPAKTPEATIRDWPESSRLAALALIGKYGEPRRFDEARLTWSDNGPWSRIVVSRDAPRGLLGKRGGDVVEESIWYDVPDNKVAALKSFDARLTVDKSTGELSSRAESEGLNFLALNLADEIVVGKKTAAEARDFYRKTVQLSESGKSSGYMDGITFSFHIPR